MADHSLRQCRCRPLRKMTLHAIGLLVVILFIGNVVCVWSDLDMISVEGLNRTNANPIKFDVWLKRHKRGVYRIYANMTVTAPLNDYMGEVVMYYSESNNNQYKLSPIRVPRGPICSKINHEYRKFIMDETRNTSDLPVTSDRSADLCAMFEEKTYCINGFEYSTEKMPKFLAAGWYKALILLSKDGTVTGGTIGLYRLT